MGSLEIIRRQCAIYGTVIDGPYERGIDRGLRIAIAILEAELEGSPGAPEPASKEEQDLERSSVSRRETRLFYHVAAMKAHAESLILAAERPHGKYDDAKVEELIHIAKQVASSFPPVPKMTKLLLDYQERYNKAIQRGMDIQSTEVSPMGISVVRPGGEEQKEVKVIEKIKDSLSSLRQEYDSVAESFVGSFQMMFDEALFREASFADAMVAGFKGMLERMISELLARAAIFAILSAVVPGFGSSAMGQGGLGSFLAKALGFQHGGSFKVGGSGGPDSQMVAFRASPGEQVTVTPQNQISNQSVRNVNVYIAGNMIGNRRFVRDVVIPEIDLAVARGL